ncbi:MAG: histone deacetylase [Deltaproteobacteria bacterium]|nr:histone deacetylase [Deltaproteobacteria bacterium]
MTRTGIVKDERYLDHDMGPFHPESPRRLQAIYGMLAESDMAGNFKEVPVRRADRAELLLVHSSEYVDMLAETEGKDRSYLDPDTSTSPGSYEAALLAAGGLCEAIALVSRGELDNAFALVRPPGHHAESSRAMGFCLFNNVAVGARYAQETLNMDRILIVDWDLHHGNGTQHSFEEDPSILYFSTHQYPYYPGSGAFGEVGINGGEGFTVNVPLSVGHGDGEYVEIFEKILKPIATQFDPDLILVSAGFDIYFEDPLGGMRVTPKGFAGMTRSLMDMADGSSGGRIVITLEGGYHVEGQRDSVKEVLREMARMQVSDKEKLMSKTEDAFIEQLRKEVGDAHRGFWKGL